MIDKQLPKIKPVAERSAQSFDYLRSRPSFDPTKINRRYRVLQEDSLIKPLDIFDDGNGWTYFRFSHSDNLDTVKNLPVIYKVVGRKDRLVNTMVRGGFIIAKTISDKFTFRHGEEYACVRAY